MALFQQKVCLVLSLSVCIQFIVVSGRSTEFVFDPGEVKGLSGRILDKLVSAQRIKSELIEFFRNPSLKCEFIYPDIDEFDVRDYEEGLDLDEVESDEVIKSDENSVLEEGAVVSDIPKRRVRRRIIPVSKAMERNRGGRRKNPFGNSRNNDRKRNNLYGTSVSRSTGPVGTEALYRLYPELAPPGWHGKKHPRPQNKKKESKKSNKKRYKTKKERLEDKRQKDEDMEAANKRKMIRKLKHKLPKQIKRDIAIYAQKNGIHRTIEHFQPKVNFTLNDKIIRKYLRRYRNHVNRKANRN